VGRIFICTACDRYSLRSTREMTRGERLARAVKAAAIADGDAVAVRMVECLNTCPNPCAAALREPGKTVIRFGGLVAEDSDALITAAKLYERSLDGDLASEALPQRLRDKVTGRVTLGLPEMARD
jgi:predicted metal-binding protein